uniref:Uncharacterized protein n=1 Tax=Aplanochytrium stocchinoi TaxID=215587 RepID=A0A7S3LRM2_9STRA
MSTFDLLEKGDSQKSLQSRISFSVKDERRVSPVTLLGMLICFFLNDPRGMVTIEFTSTFYALVTFVQRYNDQCNVHNWEEFVDYNETRIDFIKDTYGNDIEKWTPEAFVNIFGDSCEEFRYIKFSLLWSFFSFGFVQILVQTAFFCLEYIAQRKFYNRGAYYEVAFSSTQLVDILVDILVICLISNEAKVLGSNISKDPVTMANLILTIVSVMLSIKALWNQCKSNELITSRKSIVATVGENHLKKYEQFLQKVEGLIDKYPRLRRANIHRELTRLTWEEKTVIQAIQSRSFSTYRTIMDTANEVKYANETKFNDIEKLYFENMFRDSDDDDTVNILTDVDYKLTCEATYKRIREELQDYNDIFIGFPEFKKHI